MTICNMSIEAGARAGMIAPDDTTFAYLEGRPAAPRGAAWERALDAWRALRSDDGRGVRPRRSRSTSRRSSPQVTWGTNPGMVAPIDGRVPDPAAFDDPAEREAVERALRYMDLEPGHADPRDRHRPRLHRLLHELAHRGPAGRRDGRRRPTASRRRVRAMVVPGLGEGEARRPRTRASTASSRAPASSGAQAGCSMCLGMNPDILRAGRALRLDVEPQLRGPPGRGRPHAPRSPGDGRGRRVTGHFTDVRELEPRMRELRQVTGTRPRCSTAPTSTPTRSSRSSS